MIILIDIGNTNINIGSSDGNKILSIFSLKSIISKTADEYFLLLKEMLKTTYLDGVIISSVVPQLSETFLHLFEKHFNINPIFLTSGIKTGLMVKTDNPKEVGSDLIADSVGSFLYSDEALIIDLGTATKYIYVKNKTFEGCVIAPGVLISLNALVSSTALLPNIEIKLPKRIIGKNTCSAMQSGIFYGTVCQVDSMIERIKQEVKNENLFIIATGGFAKTIVPLCKSKITLDESLTLKGLLSIYNQNL